MHAGRSNISWRFIAISILCIAWAYAAFRKGGGRILLIGDLNICFECYSILNTCDVNTNKRLQL